ncbi:hypothetical protein Q3G72_031382 [Acer saccharum]|nr:hypothetical protein Q3G72_031382 [Acer saccharum]
MGRGAAGREEAADPLQPLFETKEAGKGRVAYRLFAGNLRYMFFIVQNLLMSENDIKKCESGPEIGKQPSPKYEKGIGLHGPSNCVSKSPSTVKSFTNNMFLGDGVIKVQYGNSGMGRIIDMDGMNSTLGESSKEEFLSFSVEWEAYGEGNINQKMRKDKIFSLAIKCYGMKHRSSKFKVIFGPLFVWAVGVLRGGCFSN